MTNGWTTTGVCSQLGVSSGSPSGSGREASTAETLAIRDVQPFCPGMVHAAFIAQNPANFQQKLADEPAAIILHFYPLKAYAPAAGGSLRSPRRAARPPTRRGR